MCKNNGQAMLGLGITLVVLGSLSTILGIAAAAAYPSEIYSRMYGPIWAGIFVVITGAIGIMAGRNFNRQGASVGWIPAFLTMSIIGIIVTLAQLSISSAGVNYFNIFGVCVMDNGGFFVSIFNDQYKDNWRQYCSGAIALHYTCLVLGLTEMILCFAGSIIGCVVGCSCCNPQPTPGVIIMQPGPNQAYPHGQIPNTVITGNPVYYPQAGYIQQPGGPPPSYLPPPGQQSPPYPGGAPIPAAVPPAMDHKL